MKITQAATYLDIKPCNVNRCILRGLKTTKGGKGRLKLRAVKAPRGRGVAWRWDILRDDLLTFAKERRRLGL